MPQTISSIRPWLHLKVILWHNVHLYIWSYIYIFDRQINRPISFAALPDWDWWGHLRRSQALNPTPFIQPLFINIHSFHLSLLIFVSYTIEDTLNADSSILNHFYTPLDLRAWGGFPQSALSCNALNRVFKRDWERCEEKQSELVWMEMKMAAGDCGKSDVMLHSLDWWLLHLKCPKALQAVYEGLK